MSEFDRDFGFECDNCSHTIGGGIYDFDESLEMRKAEGWISRKFDGEWYNFCSEECLNDWMRKFMNRPTPRKIRK